MMAMPPFFDFLVIQKIIKKSTPQKINFFWHFEGFLAILRPFFQDFGCILGSPGGHFSTFLAGEIFGRFFHRFFRKKKNKNSKNEKVAFVS